MMVWLRKFLQIVFGIEAAFFVPFFPFQVYFLVRSTHYPHASAAPLLLESALATVVGGICLAAWLSIKKCKPASKWWGLAASFTNIFLTFFILEYFEIRFTNLIWIVPISGVTGLFVFLNKSAMLPVIAKIQHPSPILGDGTNVAINKLGPALIWMGNAGVFFAWLRWVKVNEVPTSTGLLFFPELILILFLVVTLHELGHSVVGCALGMKLRSFVAGPFQWRIRDGKWGFKFNLSAVLNPEGAVGVVPTTAQEQRWCDISMIAAGPLANVAMAFVALCIAFRVAPDAPAQVYGLTALFGGYNLIVGLCNLIPLQSGNNYSDGARLYQLLSRGPFADLHRAISVVTSSLVSPLRPRDYDMATIARAAGSLGQGHGLMMLWLHSYSHFLDCSQLTEAEEALVKAEMIYSHDSVEIPAELHTVFVFGNAYVKHNAGSAREWWERMEAKKPTRFNGDYWLAHSALHWIEGNLDVANESWIKGNALAQQLPNAGAYEFDRYCFRLLRAAIDQSAAEQSSSRELGALQPA